MVGTLMMSAHAMQCDANLEVRTRSCLIQDAGAREVKNALSEGMTLS